MNKITLDMTIAEVMALNPEIAPVFFEYGMHCLSCPVASAETIAEAAEVHGIDGTSFLLSLTSLITSILTTHNENNRRAG